MKMPNSRIAAYFTAAALCMSTVLAVPAASAVAGTYDVGADLSFTEGASAVSALSDFTLTSAGQDYAGGSVTYSITGANESGEVLGFTTSQSASTTAGAISIVGTTVFKGNGTTADAIGNIDGTLNGQASDLKVNFANSFQNGDFSQGLTGWNVTNSRVNLGYINTSGTVVQSNATIAGFTPPIDRTFGPGTAGDFDRSSSPNTFQSSTSGSNLRMIVNGASCNSGYCVVRGPVVTSAASVYLATGDAVSFSWIANDGGDAFDVYGYLVNTQTGQAIKLIDETGRASTNSSGTVRAVMGSARGSTGNTFVGTKRTDLLTRTSGTSATTTGGSSYNDAFFTDGNAFTPGQYKFVFLAGSYDDSGGQYLGAEFIIDDVTVSSSSASAAVTSADVQAISRLMTYSNTSGLNASRTLGFSSSLTDTSTTSAQDKIISVTAVNDPPAVTAISGPTYSDTSAVDTFTNNTGTVTATDEEGATLSYSITGGTTSGSTVTKVGTYGTLVINSSTGAYTYTPNAGVINALDTNQTETFVITASDGTNTTSTNYVVTINAVIDALPGAPVIQSLSGSDRSLQVTFTPPVSTGTSAITNYQYSTDGINYRSFSPAVTTSPFTIQYLSSDGTTRLTNGTSYPITIKAVNSTGSSVASNSQTAQPGAVVVFFQNGGSGTMNSQASNNAANLSRNLFIRNSYDFAGWNTDQNGTGTWYTDEESFSFSTSLNLYAHWITASTVSWNPTTLRVLETASTLTPSSVASTSGNGTISYSVVQTSTSDCSVNSSTGVITFTTAGTCIVRATSSLTRAFYSSSADVTFVVTPTDTELDLALDLSTGQQIAGASSNYEATGLQPGSAWELILRSTPQLLASGTTDPSGSTFGSVVIPPGLEPGWHSLTLTGTSLTGQPVSKVVWFQISSNGSLLATAASAPVPSLANTGRNITGGLITGSFMMISGLLMMATTIRMRRARKH